MVFKSNLILYQTLSIRRMYVYKEDLTWGKGKRRRLWKIKHFNHQYPDTWLCWCFCPWWLNICFLFGFVAKWYAKKNEFPFDFWQSENRQKRRKKNKNSEINLYEFQVQRLLINRADRWNFYSKFSNYFFFLQSLVMCSVLAIKITYLNDGWKLPNCR